MDSLLKFYSDEGPERCGLVLDDGSVIELQNVAAQPEEAFEISDEDLIQYEEHTVASWHTHPGQTSQLSFDDYEGFLMWPDLKHHIIGNDGLTIYAVKNGKVVIDG